MKRGKNSGSGLDDGGEDRLEDHEAELAAQEAEEELKSEAGRVTEREYQKMAADLRWEVLAYLEAHPDKKVTAVAELFGIKEGTIRAWKAHSTMGTYSGGKPAQNKKPAVKPRQAALFSENKAAKTAPFVERKRYSNFIHYFDKTPPGVVCPHFHILAHANGCPFACDYCYLRLTLRHYPEPTVFTNTARMFQELRDWLLSTETPSVLNTGELSDSLAWDQDTGLSANLIALFANQTRHKVLFVTKSDAVENLLREKPTPQAIVSFSVNSSEAATRFERGAPPPEARLEAAQKLKDAGWEVRVRLDPLLPLDRWQDDYERIVERINRLEPAVVTLGSLRFFRTLVNHAPRSEVFAYGEDHNDPDGRLRLAEPVRLAMYRFLMDRLSCLRIGLCKETEKVHQELDLPGRNQSCNCTPE